MKLRNYYNSLNFHQIAEKLILAGIVIIALFISISISAVELGVAIAILGWIIKCIAERKFIVGENKIALPVLLFFISLVSSFIFSMNSTYSTKYLSKLLWHGIVFFPVVTSKDLKDKIQFIFGLIAISIFLAAIYGVLQYFFGIDLIGNRSIDNFGGRVYSFGSHPNNFAVVLIMGFPMLLYFLVSLRKAIHKILLFLAIFISSICLIFTFSRGAWIGFIIAAILWIILYNKKYLIPVVVMSILMYIFLPGQLKSTIKKRIDDSFNPKSYSTFTRWIYWKAALKMGFNQPLTGVGLGNFREVYNNKTYKYKYPQLPYFEHADCHNNYLQLFAEAGFPSIIFFLWFIAVMLQKIFLYLKKTNTNEYLVILTVLFSIVAFLINGIFDATLWQVQASVFFWLCCGIVPKK